jgi:hypothetical protein
MQEGDEVGNLTDVVIESTFRPNSILHTGVVLSAKTPAGNSVRIDGVVEGMCPTKIPFAGGVTAVNEGLVRYRLSDGRQGAGIAEQWHNVVE